MAINKRKILESAQKNLQKGLIDKALADYRTLLRADPKDSNVLLKVGDLYLKQGKREDSINSYLRVAQQFTNDGFDAKAVALYKQISRLDPKRHDVCVPLAELYSRMGLIGDAIASLQTAADAAYRDGDKDDALELLRRMAALDPSNTPNRLKVAELLAQEGRTSEALTDYEAVAEELERRGEEEERIRVVERIVALDPERAPALREVARAKLAMNQFAAAQKLAEQLIGSHGDDVDGYEILGHALLGAGETDRAQEVFRDLAERFRLRGDEDRARDLMQRFGGVEALSVDETEAPLETEEASLETEEGVLELDREIGTDGFLLEEDSAIDADELAPAIDEAPAAEAVASTPIGKIEPVQVLAPKPPAVVQSPEATADEGEPTSDPEQLLAEATVYLRYGKHDRAVGALREILASDPEHRPALEHLGEALSAQGDASNAVTAWQRAAEAARGAGDDEDFERLRARLAELDAEAAEALAGPDATSDEVDVDLDFDLDAEPLPEGDAQVEPGADAEAGEGGEVPTPEAAEIEFSDEFDGLEEIPEDIAPPAEAPGPEAEAEAVVPVQEAEPIAEPPDEDPTATTPAQLSEQLEEAEFYLEQGLLDEARDLYERILESAPSHPQAMLRLGEIDARSGAVAADVAAPEAEIDVDMDVDIDADVEAAAEAAVSSELSEEPPSELSEEPPGVALTEEPEVDLSASEAPALEPEPDTEPEAAPDLKVEAELRDESAGVVEEAAVESEDAPVAPEEAAPETVATAADPAEDTGDFDLAAELAFGFEAEEPSGGTLAGTEEEGFEQVFNAFKSGVERELGEGDQEARYDLGIAYKEMGLLEDAIGEFQIAMQVEGRRLSSLHMMGICALDLGRGADAVAHLEQALSLPELPEDQCTPLRYDLGRAYAAQGDVERARAAFEEVRSSDPEFGDVERELAALEAVPSVATEPEAEESSEAYESFDDLLAERPQEPATPRYESFDDLFADTDEAEPEAEPAQDPMALADETEEEPPVTTTPSEEESEAVAPQSAEAPLEEAEPTDDAVEPEPAPEPEASIEEPSELPPEEPEQTPEASEAPSPKRKRRKISFV